jgi:sec-independent protein translocase protein TatA
MLSGISIWQLLIILVIVLLLFGTKRLKSLGGDLGGAIKGFKKAMTEEKTEDGGDAKRVEADNPLESTTAVKPDASATKADHHTTDQK